MKKLTKAALTRLTKKALNDDADAQFVLANVYRYQAADGTSRSKNAPASLLVFRSLSCTETDKLQDGFQLGSVSPMASGPL